MPTTSTSSGGRRTPRSLPRSGPRWSISGCGTPCSAASATPLAGTCSLGGGPPTRPSASISPGAGLPAEIGALVGEVVRETGAAALFAPLGVGKHVDHLITRRAAQHLPAQ